MPTDNFQMNQPMDSMMGGDMNMPMDNQDMNMGMDNQPMDMNQEPMGDENNFDFGGNNQSEMSDDPEKQVESLIGKAASIIRKDLSSEGINKHEDKKKEVLGMLTAAIIDGMNDEEKNNIIDYLSSKIMGGEDNSSNGDEDNDVNDNQDNEMVGNEEQSDDTMEMMESIINKVMEDLIVDKNSKIKDKDITTKVKEPQKGKYSKKPYTK
jgi:hypothetical protein